MKAIDIGVAVLLVLGGLNLGLSGVYGIDLVAITLGEASPAGRVFQAFVGISAVYQTVSLESIRRRWDVAWSRA